MFRQAENTGPRRGARRAWQITVCGVAVTASVFCATSPVLAAPKPPPHNPTNSELSQAAKNKAALAQTVGELSAKIAASQSALQALSAQAELTEQKFAYAVSLLNNAKAQAAAAQADVVAAQKSIDTARSNLTDYVSNSYMSPTVGSSTISLLTASDPAALLQSNDYRNYISAHHLDAIGSLDRATVTKSNADAKAKSLVVKEQQLTAAAATAQAQARDAYQAEQAQAATLKSQQASYRTQLSSAQARLATLNGERAQYNAYQAYLAEQRRIAAAKALARKRAAEAAAAAARAAEQARQQAAAAAAAQAAQNAGNNDNSSNSSSSPVVSQAPASPAGPSAGGGWTAQKGEAAAQKALSELGVRYSWAGGGYGGPSYGVNSPGTDGWNDSTVFGFDCSGLSMYAWYPAIDMPHYALAQYSMAGSVHPSPGNFLPGDLLFWSNGGQSGIHHVAIYIGGGNVVQAPNSGDVVKVTPWDQVSSGYFGATRPLT